MKVTRKDAPIVIPPPTFAVELTADEASTLMRICDVNITVSRAVRDMDRGDPTPIANLLGAMFSALLEAGVK